MHIHRFLTKVVGAGHVHYVVNRSNNAIRSIAPDGTVTTVAGGGAELDGMPGSADGAARSVARCGAPPDVAAALDGTLYVADANNESPKKVDLFNDQPLKRYFFR